MKSGCKAEESKLRTAERLTNLMAIFCIIAWRVFWLCMINRTAPDITARTVFTKTEIKLLDHLISTKEKSHYNTINTYMTLLARLGGYLDRSHDPPPGNMVVWRGFRRLIDIHLGFNLAQKIVGNWKSVEYILQKIRLQVSHIMSNVNCTAIGVMRTPFIPAASPRPSGRRRTGWRFRWRLDHRDLPE